MYYADTARRLGENSKENPFPQHLMLCHVLPSDFYSLSVAFSHG